MTSRQDRDRLSGPASVDAAGHDDETSLERPDGGALAEEALGRNANLANIVFAILFAAEEPVSVRKLAAIIEDASADDIKAALEAWRVRFDEEAWSVRIESVAGGYQVATRPDYAPYISRLYSGRRKFRLSRAGLETLAIVAYKQPVTRAEIENIRGVSCGGVITNLMERSLVQITGKARMLGAPFLYGTTRELLEYLGLESLDDLPSLAELESLLEKEAYPERAVEADSPEEGATPEARADDEGDEPEPGEAAEDFAAVVAALDLAKKAARGVLKDIPAPGGAGAASSGEPGKESKTPAAEVASDSSIPTIDFSGEAPEGDDPEAGAEPDVDADGSGDDDETKT